MQYHVKNIINGLTSWSGLSGPIPNAGELRKKREQARQAALASHAFGCHAPAGLTPVPVSAPKRTE
jgi:hypothetical protein